MVGHSRCYQGKERQRTARRSTGGCRRLAIWVSPLRPDWPWGAVKSSEKNAETTESLSRLTIDSGRTKGYQFARGAMGVGFDSKSNSLAVRDGSGRTLFKADVLNALNPTVFDRGPIHGAPGLHLLRHGSDCRRYAFRSTLTHSQRKWRCRPLENEHCPAAWVVADKSRVRAVPFTPNVGVRLRRNFDPVYQDRAICSMGPVNENGVFLSTPEEADVCRPSHRRDHLVAQQSRTRSKDLWWCWASSLSSLMARIKRSSCERRMDACSASGSYPRKPYAGSSQIATFSVGTNRTGRYRIYLRDIWAQADVWSEDVGAMERWGALRRTDTSLSYNAMVDSCCVRWADDRVRGAHTSGTRWKTERLAGIPFRASVLGIRRDVTPGSWRAENGSTRDIRLMPRSWQHDSMPSTPRLDAACGPIPAIDPRSWFRRLPAFGLTRHLVCQKRDNATNTHVSSKRSPFLAAVHRSPLGADCLWKRRHSNPAERVQHHEQRSWRRTSTFNLQRTRIHTERSPTNPHHPAPPAQTGAASSLTFTATTAWRM